MEESIVVPLDGSALAETILPHAGVWARSTGRGLTLLQVVPPPRVPDPLLGTIVPDSVPYPTWAAQHAAAQAYLDALAPRLAADGLRVETALREGDPATIIVAHAAGTPGVAGIALTTHGRGGFDRLLLGSVAEQVLHSAPRPVLVLRPQRDEESIWLPPARPYRTIVVPLDGSPEAEQALAVARPLAAATHARIVLVGALDGLRPVIEGAVMATAGGANPTWLTLPSAATNQPFADYLEHTAAWLQTAGTPAEADVIAAPPVEAITRCSARVDADVIVMATHGRGGLDRLWHGSVALAVVQHARWPVLLVRVPPAQSAT